MNIRSLPLLVAGLFSCKTIDAARPSLEDLWHNRAHFEARGELQFGNDRGGRPVETASWFAVRDGRWYAFSRVGIFPSIPACPHEHMRVVVRQSADKGKSWSSPVVAVEPGKKGDACAVLDGSSYYDRDAGLWHLLAQCLELHNAGGWGLCHYTRRSNSPVGRFVADPSNPVVRGGQLWSRICGPTKACPIGVIDEGTPDIVTKRGGLFLVTIHGFDQRSGRGYRTAVATPDFKEWRTAGEMLPNDATLSRKECAFWFPSCVGFGEGASLISGGRIYTVTETMDKSLLCQNNQHWVFVLMRSKASGWPPSGSGGWEQFRQLPLIKRTWPDPQTPCGLSYARLIADRGNIYLTYEDWEPNHTRLHRRLFVLVPSSK